MISETGQLEILQGELAEARPTIDYLREELWIRTQDLNQAYDRLYDSVVLLASCNSCSDESLRWLLDRCSESDGNGATVEALCVRDARSSFMLRDVGIDLDSRAQLEVQPVAQGTRSV